MKLKATMLFMTALAAIGLAHAQEQNCVKCLGGAICTSSVPNGNCACFFGDYGCQGTGLCKNGQCLRPTEGASCPSIAGKTRVGPEFATNKDMSKVLFDSVDAHSHTLARLIRLLLPHIAKGTQTADGYLGTPDHTDETKTTYRFKNGEFTFTIDHPVSPDAGDAPTRLVVHGHEWALYNDSGEVGSGRLSDRPE